MLVLAGVQTVSWARQQAGHIPYHPPKGPTPTPTKPDANVKKRADREKELEMKIQEHTKLLLRLEEELDKSIASGKLTKAELGKLQTAYDELQDETEDLKKEYSDLQKKRMKLAS